MSFWGPFFNPKGLLLAVAAAESEILARFRGGAFVNFLACSNDGLFCRSWSIASNALKAAGKRATGFSEALENRAAFADTFPFIRFLTSKW
jgi:hypothetical protein